MRKSKNFKETATFPTDTNDRGNIGQDNWVDRFMAWTGKTVIRNRSASDNREATPAPWNAWMGWFAGHGISTAFFESHGVVTVPETWPEDFDSVWYPSDREWLFPAFYADAGVRSRVADGLNSLVDEMGAGGASRRRRTNFEAEAQKQVALEALERCRDQWRSPLVLSEAARETMRR